MKKSQSNPFPARLMKHLLIGLGILLFAPILMGQTNSYYEEGVVYPFNYLGTNDFKQRDCANPISIGISSDAGYSTHKGQACSYDERKLRLDCGVWDRLTPSDGETQGVYGLGRNNWQVDLSLEVQFPYNTALNKAISIHLDQEHPFERREIAYNYVGNNLPNTNQIKVCVVGIQINTNQNLAQILSFMQQYLHLDLSKQDKIGRDIHAPNGNLLTLASTNASMGANGGGIVNYAWTMDSKYMFEGFDLEVLKLEMKEGTNGDIDPTLDWAKALKVEVPWENGTITGTDRTISYPLTVAEGTGIYAWRVRPVGSYYGQGRNDVRNVSDFNWTTVAAVGVGEYETITIDHGDGAYAYPRPSGNGITSGITNINTANSTNGLFYYTQFDTDINWSYGRVFTEEGRVSESMTFANGLGQVIQTQTKLQSIGQVIGVQNVYDFSGRAALSTLPAPTMSNTLGYKSDFFQAQLNGNTKSYSAENFDTDDKIYSPDPPTVSNVGPVHYYSNANNVTEDKYVPNANESDFSYVFSRTLFEHNGMNRVYKQAGVGPEMKLQDDNYIGHNIVTEYSAVAQDELDRVFGSEAPIDSFVMKTITEDANGVRSVSYMSKTGQILATALDGATRLDDGVVMENTEDEMADGLWVTYQMKGGNLAANKKSRTESLSINVPIDPADPTALPTIDFQYDIYQAALSLVITPGDPLTCGICLTCDYHIEITLIDEKGDPMDEKAKLVYDLDGKQVCEAIQLSTVPGGINVNVLPAPPTLISNFTLTSMGFSINVPPGTYKIIKKVSIDNKDILVGNVSLSKLSDAEAELETKIKDDYCAGTYVPPVNDCNACKVDFGATTPDEHDLADFLTTEYLSVLDLERGSTYRGLLTVLQNELSSEKAPFNISNPITSTELNTYIEGLIGEWLLENNDKTIADLCPILTGCFTAAMAELQQNSTKALSVGATALPTNTNPTLGMNLPPNLATTPYYDSKFDALQLVKTCLGLGNPAVSNQLFVYIGNTPGPSNVCGTPGTRCVQMTSDICANNTTDPQALYNRHCLKSFWFDACSYTNVSSHALEYPKNGLSTQKAIEITCNCLDNYVAPPTPPGTAFPAPTAPAKLPSVVYQEMEDMCKAECDKKGLQVLNAMDRFYDEYNQRQLVFNPTSSLWLSVSDAIWSQTGACGCPIPATSLYENRTIEIVQENCSTKCELDKNIAVYSRWESQVYAPNGSDPTYTLDNAITYINSVPPMPSPPITLEALWDETYQLEQVMQWGISYASEIANVKIDKPTPGSSPMFYAFAEEGEQSEVQSEIVEFIHHQWDRGLLALGRDDPAVSPVYPDAVKSDLTALNTGEHVWQYSKEIKVATHAYPGMPGAIAHTMNLIVNLVWEQVSSQKIIKEMNFLLQELPATTPVHYIAKWSYNPPSCSFDAASGGWNSTCCATQNMYSDLPMQSKQWFKVFFDQRSSLHVQLNGGICPSSGTALSLNVGAGTAGYAIVSLPATGTTLLEAGGNPDPSIVPPANTSDYTYLTANQVIDYTTMAELQTAINTTISAPDFIAFKQGDVLPDYLAILNIPSLGANQLLLVTNGYMQEDISNWAISDESTMTPVPLVVPTSLWDNSNFINNLPCIIPNPPKRCPYGYTLLEKTYSPPPPPNSCYDPTDPCLVCLRWAPPTTPQVQNEGGLYIPPCQEVYDNFVNMQSESFYQNLYNKHLEILRNSYTENCIEKLDDNLKVKVKLNYHHYTLYYYDRAGNLMRTVPPAGVHILTPGELAEVKAYRTELNQVIAGNIAQIYKFPNYLTTHPLAHPGIWPITTVSNTATDNLHKMVTFYRYNSIHQLLEVVRPDGNDTYPAANADNHRNRIRTWYNAKGQAVLSQDARQRAYGYYSYTKYDELGRAIEGGELTAMPGVNTNGDVVVELWEEPNFPDNVGGASKQEVVRTIYSFPRAGLNYMGRYQQHLRNRVSYVTKDFNGDGQAEVFFGYSYDPHGNVEWLIESLPDLGPKKLRYEYDLISGKVRKLVINEGEPDQFWYRYTYDEDNRITAAFTSRDGSVWDRDAHYDYYKHGPLSRIGIGQDQIQGIDYVYTLEGYLKTMNHPSLQTANDPGEDIGANPDAQGKITGYLPDEWGMELSYYDGDYTKTGTDIGTADGNANPFLLGNKHELFNGNISYWRQNSRFGNYPPTGSNLVAMGEHLHEYHYDKLNRIRSANILTHDHNPNPYWDALPNNQWAENFHYDGNGNITQLERYGISQRLDKFQYIYNCLDGSGSLVPQVPSFTNNFSPVSNKLKAVYDEEGASVLPNGEDLGDQTGGAATNLANDNYFYDDAGNLIWDISQSLLYIWNHAGKLSAVVKFGATIQDLVQIITFDYDPSGNRIAKHVTHYQNNQYQSRKSSYYLRDPQGNVLAVYEGLNDVNSTANTLQIAAKEFHLYGSDRLGLMQVNIPFKHFPVQRYAAISEIRREEGAVEGMAGYRFKVEQLPLRATGNEENNRDITSLSYKLMHDYYALIILKINTLTNLNIAHPTLHNFANAYLNFIEPFMAMEEQRINLLDATLRTEILVRTRDVMNLAISFEEDHNREVWQDYPYGDLVGGILALLNQQIEAERTHTALILRSLIFQSLLYDSPFTPYDTTGEFHEGEKIILRNVTENSLSLQGWKIRNTTTGESYTFGANSSLAAGTNLVFPDSLGISLPDDGATLVIENPEGERIDAITYTGEEAPNNFGQMSSLKVLNRVYYSLHAGNELPNSYRTTEIEEAQDAQRYSYVYVGSRKLGDKVYELKDHLGNVRVTVSDVRLSTITSGGLSEFHPEVMSMSDYYAFGMLMVGRNWSAESYRYGFQGQELDNEEKGVGNSINYTYRVHDPRLGRFLSIDPLSPKYPQYSPYHFSSNQPIHAKELEGLESANDLDGADPGVQYMYKRSTEAGYGGTLLNNHYYNIFAAERDKYVFLGLGISTSVFLGPVALESSFITGGGLNVGANYGSLEDKSQYTLQNGVYDFLEGGVYGKFAPAAEAFSFTGKAAIEYFIGHGMLGGFLNASKNYFQASYDGKIFTTNDFEIGFGIGFASSIAGAAFGLGADRAANAYFDARFSKYAIAKIARDNRANLPRATTRAIENNLGAKVSKIGNHTGKAIKFEVDVLLEKEESKAAERNPSSPNIGIKMPPSPYIFPGAY